MKKQCEDDSRRKPKAPTGSNRESGTKETAALCWAARGEDEDG